MGDKAKRPTATLSMLEGRKPGPSENRRVPKEFQKEEFERRRKKAASRHESDVNRAQFDAMGQVILDEILGHDPSLDEEGMIGGSVPVIGNAMRRGGKTMTEGLRKLFSRFGGPSTRPQLAKEFAIEKVTKGGPGVLKRDVDAAKALVKTGGGKIMPLPRGGGPLVRTSQDAAKGAQRVKVRTVQTEGPRVGPSGAPIQTGGKVQGQLAGTTERAAASGAGITTEQIAALEAGAAPAAKLSTIASKLGKAGKWAAVTGGLLVAGEQFDRDSNINFTRPLMRKALGPSKEEVAETVGTVAEAKEKAAIEVEKRKARELGRARLILKRRGQRNDPEFDPDILELKLRSFDRRIQEKKKGVQEGRKSFLRALGEAAPGDPARDVQAMSLPSRSLLDLVAPASDRGRESAELRRELLRSMETGVEDVEAALIQSVADDNLMDD